MIFWGGEEHIGDEIAFLAIFFGVDMIDLKDFILIFINLISGNIRSEISV